MSRHLLDGVLALTLAALAAGAAYDRSARLHPALLSYCWGNTRMTDVWFDGDVPKVFLMVTRRDANQHDSSSEHPLAPLIASLPVAVLRHAAGLEPSMATRGATAIWAAAWAALLYALLRLLGIGVVEAVLFCALGLMSASAVFWFAVPELFSIGSVTLLSAMCLVAVGERRGHTWPLHLAVSVITLAVTITNWLLGLLAAAIFLDRRRAWRVTVTALVLVCVSWSVQKVVFPASAFFIGSTRPLEFIHWGPPSRVGRVLASFWCHSIVMPRLQDITRTPKWHVLSVQESPPDSASLPGAVALTAWGALVGLGFWGLLQSRKRKWRLFLLAAIGAEIAFHIVFGAETFLYSMHFLPKLIVLAAFSTLTPYRYVAVGLAAVALLGSAANNVQQFRKAAAIVDAAALPSSGPVSEDDCSDAP